MLRRFESRQYLSRKSLALKHNGRAVWLVASPATLADNLSRQAYWLCLSSRIGHGNEILIGGNNDSRIDFEVYYEVVWPADKAINHTDLVSNSTIFNVPVKLSIYKS